MTGAPDARAAAVGGGPAVNELLVGVGCAAGVVLLGAPVGLLWSALAPRADVAASPAGGLDVLDRETKDFIAGDGTLFLLCLLAGFLAGAVCWRLARRYPLGSLLGLVAGSAFAAWVAWRTGLLGEDRAALLAAARAGQVSGAADLPLQLRATSVLLAWPAAAAGTFASLLWRRPDPLLSGGQDDPPTP